MYGTPWNESLGEIPMEGKVVIVVGGTKVPGELFGIDVVATGNRPHSEVAALAVSLTLTWDQ